MLTLLLVCSFSPRVHSIPRGPQNIAKAIVYAQRFVASNNATHSCDKSHNRWLCPLRSISANASACFSLRLRSARRGSRRRRHGIAAQSPRKEKEPDKIGFVFFSCGGDEGGRTPYLLNAIQALYQLSYTPKADNKRKYTIFTSFCQLHLNKWVKCFGTNFFVYLIHSRFARARAARTLN